MSIRFGVDTQFSPTGKRGKQAVYTVMDVHTTRNLAGDVVKVEYVCGHAFCGQIVKSLECETTIARGIIGAPAAV